MKHTQVGAMFGIWLDICTCLGQLIPDEDNKVKNICHCESLAYCSIARTVK